MSLTPTQERALAALREHGHIGMQDGFREATFRALERAGYCRVTVSVHPERRYTDIIGWNTARSYREWRAVKI